MNKLIDDLGFVVISPEPNYGRFVSTYNSILNNYNNENIVCVMPPKTGENIATYKKKCPTYCGKNTITSLINLGMKKTKCKWNLLIIEGTWVKPNIDKKYSNFIKSEKEVLFPIFCDYDIQGKIVKIYQDFWNCSLNGILFNKKIFEEVGEISDGSLNDVRLSWNYAAVTKGWTFKAILGAKIC